RGTDEARIRVRDDGRVEIRGATITSANASSATLEITVAGRAFTVNTAGARLLDRDDAPLSFADFAVGHEVRVKGVFSPPTSTSSIAANKVVDRSLEIDEVVNPDDVIAPVISGIAALPGVNSAAITWTTNEPSTSKVFFGTTSPLVINASTTQSVTNAALVTSHSIVVTGLSANTTYVFVVQSADAAGNTSTSGQFSFTTQSAAATAVPVISGITATPGTTTATIAFNTDIPAIGTVFFGTLNPFNFINAIGNPSQFMSHAFSLVGLAANTTHFYVVLASNAVGSAVSNLFTFTTAAAPDTTAPIVSGITATATASTTATIAWTTNEPATSKVFFSTVSPLDVNASTTQSVTNVALVTSHSMGLAGLTASTTYVAAVQSADAAGNTATSAPFSFTTPSTP
ncbi:fibronectin type III domain-containing protein, partial [Candidatus Kaiserbacteria bacterium]|nr:fibronectin type III domain-containing protein [Candidatus Kaiserbacteria bacterium]